MSRKTIEEKFCLNNFHLDNLPRFEDKCKIFITERFGLSKSKPNQSFGEIAHRTVASINSCEANDTVNFPTMVFDTPLFKVFRFCCYR